MISACSHSRFTTRGIPREYICTVWIASFEKIGSPFAPGDAQPLGDVAEGFFQRQRRRAAAQRDALAKLAQLRQLQLLFQFRLAGQHDLQKLFRGGFQVRQQPDFLEHFAGEILRFVHDQHGRFAGAITFQQPLVEPQQHLALLARFAGNFEFRHDEIEQLVHVQLRIEDVGGRHSLPVQPVEQPIEQRGLSGAHFPVSRMNPFRF